MAVSIDRWAPGSRVRPARVSATLRRNAAVRAQPRVVVRRLRVQCATGDSSTLRLRAHRVFALWLGCGLALLLTCPPLAGAQTVLGAVSLWLVVVPAISLVAALIVSRSPRPQ